MMTKHNKIKTTKRKGHSLIITQSTCQKKIEEGHSIEGVWYTASCDRESHPIAPPDRNYLAFAPKGIACIYSYSVLYSRTRSIRPTDPTEWCCSGN